MPASFRDPKNLPAREWAAWQARRRKALWALLGDLPWAYRPKPPKLIESRPCAGFRLERLELDLNGIEPVPALLLIPDQLKTPAPALLFLHWHGGMYGLGKRQLIEGTGAQPAYAPLLAELGIVTLAIDSWCFGERQHEKDGRVGEENAFKRMLWRGQVLWGMMMLDELRALDYLSRRPEVDHRCLGVLGMSMGATQAWWLAALEPRVQLCVDLCCLTDFDELIRAGRLSGHGIYYYVPSLLKHFDAGRINELIVPRPRLSLNGARDPLTPPAGVEKIRDRVVPLYAKYGRAEDCRIELFPCGHEEVPEMRALVTSWLRRYLAGTSGRERHNI